MKKRLEGGYSNACSYKKKQKEKKVKRVYIEVEADELSWENNCFSEIYLDLWEMHRNFIFNGKKKFWRKTGVWKRNLGK